MTARFPRIVAALAGATFALFGLWALIAPESFFEQLATFAPYNQHFIQDIGSFQIGLGATLLLAVAARTDTLATALLGAGAGGVAHAISHIIGRDLGGKPARDIPVFLVLSATLLVAGWMQATRSAPRA